MARRADWDIDDDFEIVTEKPVVQTPEKFELIENDTYEITPCTNTSPPLINTTPIEINQVKKSVENSSPLSQKSVPIRYGTASMIPHNEDIDLKSILTSRPSLTNQTNDLLDYIQNEKSKKPVYTENTLQQLLIANHHDRQSLVQIAKQAQQDFMKVIDLD